MGHPPQGLEPILRVTPIISCLFPVKITFSYFEALQFAHQPCEVWDVFSLDRYYVYDLAFCCLVSAFVLPIGFDYTVYLISGTLSLSCILFALCSCYGLEQFPPNPNPVSLQKTTSHHGVRFRIWWTCSASAMAAWQRDQISLVWLFLSIWTQ